MIRNQCLFCTRYQGAKTCSAFEGQEIPQEIWRDDHDHRLPFDGDGGKLFEQDPEEKPYFESDAEPEADDDETELEDG